MMMDKDIKVTYKNYTLIQKPFHDSKQSCAHAFFKNKKRFDCLFGVNPITRNTKKQLYYYLQYLVDNDIITKFDKIIIDDKGNQNVPAVFDETKNIIEYDTYDANAVISPNFAYACLNIKSEKQFYTLTRMHKIYDREHKKQNINKSQ